MTAPATKHRPTAAILAALREAGWVFVASAFPGNVTYAHPRSGEELPTPDYMLGTSAWPFDTFHRLRQVSFNYEDDRIRAVWARQCVAPWIRESTTRLSFKRAAEFIREEWTP